MKILSYFYVYLIKFSILSLTWGTDNPMITWIAVPFLNEEIAKKSIYEYLEKELKLKIAYSRRDINFRKITPEEQKYLKLKDINMVVVIETHAYLSNGTLFQYETIIHHPEKFTFTAIAKR